MIKIQIKKNLADIPTILRITIKNVRLETSEMGFHRFYFADVYINTSKTSSKKIGSLNNVEAKNMIEFKNKAISKIFNNIKL